MADFIRQIINIGSSPNDGQGDPLRAAFNKINSNFAEVYDGVTPTTGPDAGIAVRKTFIGSDLRVGTGNAIVNSTENGNIALTTNGFGSTVVTRLRLGTGQAPSGSVGDEGDVAGTIAWDQDYFYVCVANWNGVSDIWKRVALDGTSW
jgi:hypothetical protein